MHTPLCLVVIALVAFSNAFYKKSTANFYTRNVVDPMIYELIPCPDCPPLMKELTSILGEECPQNRYKKCLYGVYNNKNCRNMLDCYRGPNEICTLESNDDDIWKCAAGYKCNAITNRCEGLGSEHGMMQNMAHFKDNTYRLKSDDTFKNRK